MPRISPAHARATHARAAHAQDAAGAAPTGAPHSEQPEVGGGFVTVLAFCGIVVSVMQTLVVPLVADLPKLLHTTTSNASWVITATLLAGAVATPVMGRLGDMFGKRRMLIVALGLLVVGSLICALTSELVLMVIGRAIQGGAMGAIPLGISIMRDELPPKRLGSAMALMSSSLGIGGALGMPAAAFVAQHSDWHVLFFGSAGLGLIAIVLVLLAVPESALRAPGRFDVIGAVGLSVGLVALLLPITKGSDWGWGSPTTLGLLGAAVVILVGWGFLELRTANPLVDLRTTARRQVLLTNLASILVGFSYYAMSLVLPQLLELPKATGYGLGQSMVVAGLCVAPMGAAMMLVSPLSARINTTRGPKVSLMAGLVVIGAGYGGGMAMLTSVWQIAIISAVIGTGVGIAYSAMPTLIISAVPAGETGAANGLNTLMRSIGTSTSSAVVGVILARQTTRLGAVELPNMTAFRTAFAVACAAAILGLLIAFFLPARRAAAVAAATDPIEAAVPAEATVPAEAAEDAGAVAETVAVAKPVTTVEPVTAVDSAAALGARAAVDTGAAVDAGADAAPPAGRVIHGKVLGPDAAPVPGAAVTLIDTAGRQLGRTLSDSGGRYSVRAPEAGSFVVIGSAAGHRPRATTVPVADAPVACELLLDGGDGVTGTVRSEGGPALAGAVVTATDARGEVAASAMTGADGAFSLPQLSPGPYALTVSAADHRPYAVQTEITGGPAQRVDVELRSAVTVRGTVRDRGGRPLEDARVSLLDSAGDVVARCVTDEGGGFAFTDLADGQYTVLTAGYAPATTPITLATDPAPAAVRQVDFLLTHG
ncbi:MFS transporter [Streptomyces sp. NPDC050610]|uniref:MFS transporter n=1 Tax=Streptomyces sp. NPDC050610 TaxID=3157097 RepID=UPI0034470AB8